MKTKKKWIILVGSLIILLLIILGVVFFFWNYNYLIVRSPYRGYEAGYEYAIVSKEQLLSPLMKNTDDVEYETVLMDEDKYTYNEENGSVVDKGESYLYMNKYPLTAKLGDQSDDITISIYDTMAPVFLNQYDTITAEQNSLTEDDLVMYFDVFDFDIDGEFGVYANDLDLKTPGKYLIKVMGWDTSGNYKKLSIVFEVISSEEAQKNPQRLTINRKGYAFVTKETESKIDMSLVTRDISETKFGNSINAQGMIFKTQEEMDAKERELEALRLKILGDEDTLKRKLLADQYEDYIKEEQERHQAVLEKHTQDEVDNIVTSEGVEITEEEKEEKKEEILDNQPLNPYYPVVTPEVYYPVEDVVEPTPSTTVTPSTTTTTVVTPSTTTTTVVTTTTTTVKPSTTTTPTITTKTCDLESGWYYSKSDAEKYITSEDIYDIIGYDTKTNNCGETLYKPQLEQEDMSISNVTIRNTLKMVTSNSASLTIYKQFNHYANAKQYVTDLKTYMSNNYSSAKYEVQNPVSVNGLYEVNLVLKP